MITPLEKEITSKVGVNHTKEFLFTDTVNLVQKNEIETVGVSFYTLKGNVFINDHRGRNNSFDMYNNQTQILIFQNIMNSLYKKRKWYEQLHRK